MSNVFIELENAIEQKAKIEEKIGIAKKLISKNMSIPDIIDCTGLDEELVRNLAV